MVVLITVERRALKLEGADPACPLAAHSCCAFVLVKFPPQVSAGTQEANVEFGVKCSGM